MNILAIENSTAHFSAALKTDRTVLQCSVLYGQTSEDFTALLDFLFRQASLNVSDVDLFVMGTGPGSFTGLRTSLSIIKGFHAALGKPCMGIPGYAGITRQYAVAETPCAVIFDAKKNKIYGGVYCRQGDNVIRMIQEDVYDLDDFLVNRCGTDYLFAGESIKFVEKIRDIYPFAPVLSDTAYPEPRFLIDQALQRCREGDPGDTPDNIELLYIHPDTCNVRI